MRIEKEVNFPHVKITFRLNYHMETRKGENSAIVVNLETNFSDAEIIKYTATLFMTKL